MRRGTRPCVVWRRGTSVRILRNLALGESEIDPGESEIDMQMEGMVRGLQSQRCPLGGDGGDGQRCPATAAQKKVLACDHRRHRAPQNPPGCSGWCVQQSDLPFGVPCFVSCLPPALPPCFLPASSDGDLDSALCAPSSSAARPVTAPDTLEREREREKNPSCPHRLCMYIHTSSSLVARRFRSLSVRTRSTAPR